MYASNCRQLCIRHIIYALLAWPCVARTRCCPEMARPRTWLRRIRSAARGAVLRGGGDVRPVVFAAGGSAADLCRPRCRRGEFGLDGLGVDSWPGARSDPVVDARG